MSDPLKAEIKNLIIRTLKMKDTRPEDIDDAAPLVGGGMELDSLDALEVVVALEREYGIKIETSEDSKAALRSVDALVAFVRANSPKFAAAR